MKHKQIRCPDCNNKGTLQQQVHVECINKYTFDIVNGEIENEILDEEYTGDEEIADSDFYCKECHELFTEQQVIEHNRPKPIKRSK